MVWAGNEPVDAVRAGGVRKRPLLIANDLGVKAARSPAEPHREHRKQAHGANQRRDDHL
jgi:hypothetical protein